MRKKFAVVLFSVIFCLSLVGCDVPFYSFERTGVGEGEISAVQLIEYDADVKELKWWMNYIIPSLWWHPLSFDNDKCEVIETLKDDKKEDFATHLKSSYGYYQRRKYNSPKGVCLKIIYSDGNFLVIDLDAFGYVGEYASDGSVVTFFGVSNVNPAYIINDYFEYQFENEFPTAEDGETNDTDTGN